MKEKTSEEILRTFDEMAANLGFASYSEGIDLFCRYIEECAEFPREARTRDGLKAMLMKEPEPNPVELTVILPAIRKLPYIFRKVLPQAAKTLPHDPGGHPPMLTPEEGRAVCEEIGLLLAQGVELKNAQLRIAHRKGVSLRTIRRVWQNKEELCNVLRRVMSQA